MVTGDLLRTNENQHLSVENVFDSGAEELVYNLRVEEYHTYFVGKLGWGFAVWSHNRCSPIQQLNQTEKGARANLRRALGGVKAGEQAHHIIPWELRTNRLVQLAARGGFGINSKANGVILSTVIHLGSHPKYTTAIELALNQIARRVGNQPFLAALELQRYTARVRNGLLGTTSHLH